MESSVDRYWMAADLRDTLVKLQTSCHPSLFCPSPQRQSLPPHRVNASVREGGKERGEGGREGGRGGEREIKIGQGGIEG